MNAQNCKGNCTMRPILKKFNKDPPQYISLYSAPTHININRINSFNFWIQMVPLPVEYSKWASTFHLLPFHLLPFHLLMKKSMRTSNSMGTCKSPWEPAAVGFEPKTSRSNTWQIWPQDYHLLMFLHTATLNCHPLTYRSVFQP